MTKNKEKHWFS